MLLFFQDVQQPYPTLTYDSTTKQFRVIVEGQAIHLEGPNDGIKTMIASYWTLNLQFKKAGRNFYRLCLGLCMELVD